MIKKLVAFTLLAIVLFGCDNNKDNGHFKYSGIWEEKSTENLIEISNTGDVTLYECTFTGYQKVTSEGFTMKIEGDDLISTTEKEVTTTELSIQDNILSLIISGEEVSTMEKLDYIPTDCSGSAIQISYISTTEVNEGEEATFTIDFNYRLTEPVAEIEVYFSTNNGALDAPRQDTLEVLETVNGNGSITLNYTPSRMENDEPFYVYLYMLKSGEQSGTSLALGIDKRLITIHPR